MATGGRRSQVGYLVGGEGAMSAKGPLYTGAAPYGAVRCGCLLTVLWIPLYSTMDPTVQCKVVTVKQNYMYSNIPT